jgi:hypothetical protein
MRYRPLKLLSVCLSVVSCLAGDHAAAGEDHGLHWRFLLTAEADLNRSGTGLVMSCPAHRHGSLEEACRKLRETSRPPGGEPRICWVCRVRLHETLPRVAPLVDTVVVNPFLRFRQVAPALAAYPWSVPHPVLNEICELKRLAGKTRVVGCLDLRGEESLFGERKASAEEADWMSLALVGSGYGGICWRDSAAVPAVATRFRQQVKCLREHAGALARSVPSSLATFSAPNVPLACRQGPDRIAVVLLHPDLMRTARHGGVSLPVRLAPVEGTLSLALPARCVPSEATTLSGFPLGIARVPSKRVWTIPVRFSGGAVMVIVRTKPKPMVPPPPNWGQADSAAGTKRQ